MQYFEKRYGDFAKTYIFDEKEQLKHKTGEEIVDADIAQQMETK